MFILNRLMTRRPWSIKKRLLTTTAISGLILALSLTLGSLIYGFGRVIGIFKSESLVQAVTAEVLKDPRLIARFYHALDERICHNEELGYDLTITSPLRVTSATGRNQCSEFVMVGPMGDPAYIKVQGYPKPAAVTLAAHLVGMTQVHTDAFNHPRYPATSVRGYQGNQPVMFIIVSPDNYSSWSLIYYPADPVGEQVLEKLAKSFQLHDN